MRKFLIWIIVLFTLIPDTFAFRDVDDANPYRQAIDYLAQHDIVSGYANGTFQPNSRITRAELLQIIAGILASDQDTAIYRNCFADVGNEWFAFAVCYAKSQNWVGGYGNANFLPGRSVNRAEAAKILINAFGIPFANARAFGDVSEGSWYENFSKTLLTRKLVEWDSFQADRAISRGEVAEIIFRILVLKNARQNYFSQEALTDFDSNLSPQEIIADGIRLDFIGVEVSDTDFAVLPWSIRGGKWTQKPILVFNGKDYLFPTIQDYLEALEEIRQHFVVIGERRFDDWISRYRDEFENVFRVLADRTSIATSADSETGGDSSDLLTGGGKHIGQAVNFGNADIEDEASVRALGGIYASRDSTNIYIGYEKFPPNNYNPIVISFTDGKLDWVRRDYETTADEGMGYGLIWSSEALYAVFTSRGFAEDLNRDFRRFAKQGWLSDYGTGEGKRISVIAKIDPSNGDILSATYLSARRESGETNSLNVTDLEMNGENLVVQAESWLNPRRITRQPMERKLSAPNSPFDYTIEFTPDLTEAVRAQAPDFGQ